MLHSKTIRLIHVDQLETLYLCYGSHVNLRSFRVTGSKGQFHQICYFSSMLHSMTITLIHDDQFETLNLCYGVTMGSFGVTGVKRLFSLKLL